MNEDQDPIVSQERMYRMLSRDLEFCRKAIETKDERTRERYLDYLLGGLEHLVPLYEPYGTADESPEGLYKKRELPFKKHGKIMSFILGD